MKLDPAVHRLSKNNGAFQPTDFKVDLGPSIHRFSIYGTVQQPPLPRDGHGQEDHVYGGVVPQGYVTPAPPCGCGRGLRW